MSEPTLEEWLDEWEAQAEAGQTRLSRQEAIELWEKRQKDLEE